MNLEKIEAVFFSVLEDISGYLSDLTLVGGWMPYIYSNFLWKTSVKNPVTTADIDFGVDQPVTGDYAKTIFETLSSLDYKERLKMDRMFPIVLYKEKVPVEFITYPTVDIKAIEKMVGQQIQINKIDKFDFLLKHRIPINVQGKQKDKSHLSIAQNHQPFCIIKERLLFIGRAKRNGPRTCTTCISSCGMRLTSIRF